MELGAMELVEREEQLAGLADAWGRARAGAGRVVLVSGEAGIGKTALIERFLAANGRGARLLRGGCDDLFSPQPLGPFIEMAAQMAPGLLPAPSAGRLAFSAAFLRALHNDPRPSLLVLEDLHWADEATLDVVKFLGRRVGHSRALLILSYRDDELGDDHPLRSLLGDLPAQQTLRLALPPLSPGAVARLAGGAGRSEALYRVTGGNPFFVTEILASQGDGVPPSVRDAVLARVGRLSPAARRIVELASLVPGSAEGWLMEEVLRPDPAALDECIARGILRPVGRTPARRNLTFRHELARQSVEDSLPIGRARSLHGRILAALLPRESEEVPLARLVHHALRAGDEATTLRLAPQAARQAAALGAHREALALYSTLLRYRQRLTPAMQAEVLECLSVENYLIDRAAEAIHARQQAMDIRQQLGQDDRVGDGYRWLSRFYWMAGDGQEAQRYIDRAIAILETLPPGPELAMAISAKSQLHMLAWEEGPALAWGNRAIALAEQLGDVEILVHAMTNVGSMETLQNQAASIEKIVAALRLAQAHDLQDHVGRAYSNLGSHYIRWRQHEAGRLWLEEGLEYVTARDLDTYTIYLRGWLARMYFEMGHWAEAEAQARQALGFVHQQTITSLPALVTLAHLKVRQGDPAAADLLERAYALALPTREIQRHAPVAAARAEAVWLAGQPELIPAVAGLGYELALGHNDPWVFGELAYWMSRAGFGSIPLERVAPPYADMMRGQWAAAAQAWAALGCPYELALAWSEGDPAAQLRALALFEALDARPAADMLRRRLAAAGMARPAKPARAAHPDNQTPPEQEKQRMNPAGQTHPAIADALTISVGTVKAHTASIYSKLGVANRVQALSRSQELQLL